MLAFAENAQRDGYLEKLIPYMKRLKGISAKRVCPVLILVLTLHSIVKRRMARGSLQALRRENGQTGFYWPECTC